MHRQRNARPCGLFVFRGALRILGLQKLIIASEWFARPTAKDDGDLIWKRVALGCCLSRRVPCVCVYTKDHSTVSSSSSPFAPGETTARAHVLSKIVVRRRLFNKCRRLVCARMPTLSPFPEPSGHPPPHNVCVEVATAKLDHCDRFSFRSDVKSAIDNRIEWAAVCGSIVLRIRITNIYVRAAVLD